jgi:hypothetical protein
VIEGIHDMHLALERAGGRAGGCRGGLAAPPPTRALDLRAMRSLIGIAVSEPDVIGGGLRTVNCNLRLAGNEPPVVLALFANLNAQARNRGKNGSNLNSGPWEKLTSRGKLVGKTVRK